MYRKDEAEKGIQVASDCWRQGSSWHVPNTVSCVDGPSSWDCPGTLWMVQAKKHHRLNSTSGQEWQDHGKLGGLTTTLGEKRHVVSQCPCREGLWFLKLQMGTQRWCDLRWERLGCVLIWLPSAWKPLLWWFCIFIWRCIKPFCFKDLSDKW